MHCAVSVALSVVLSSYCCRCEGGFVCRAVRQHGHIGTGRVRELHISVCLYVCPSVCPSVSVSLCLSTVVVVVVVVCVAC